MSKKLVIALVVLLVAAGAGYTLLNKKSTDTNKSDPATSSNDTQSTNNSQNKSAEAKSIDDACQVLTTAEVSAAFGVTAQLEGPQSKKITQSNGDTKQTCRWIQLESEAGSISKAYAFSLDVENYADNTSAESKHTALNVTTGGQSFVEVSGIGSAASFKRNTSVDKSSTQLEWVKGKTIYRFTAVRLDGVSTPEEDAKIKALVDPKF